MTNAYWHKQMTKAYEAWDRSTAYMCARRGEYYDDALQRELKAAWDAVRAAHEASLAR